MTSNTQIIIVILIGLNLCGCIRGVEPTAQEFELAIAKSDALLIDDLVLTKQVIMKHGKENRVIYLSEKSVDVTATSKFGKEHEIANVDCIVAGMRGVLKKPIIITPAEFWDSVGIDKDKLNLASLFDKNYSHINNILDLDFIVVAYHQLVDEKLVFMEYYVEGGYVNDDREVAATVTVDMRRKEVIDAIELNAHHSTIIGHIIIAIPLVAIEYSKDDLCTTVGKHAAEAISRYLSSNTAPRIAVVAGDWETIKQSFVNKQYLATLHERARQEDHNAQWELYKEQPTEDNLVMLCRAADQGHIQSRIELSKLYFYGSEKLHKFEHPHISPDLSRSCAWSHLAGTIKIIDDLQSIDYQFLSKPYESPEVERTAKVMTVHELEDAKIMVQAWEPGQCDSDFIEYLGAEYTADSNLARLCTEADQGDFSARDELGGVYFFGFSGVEADLPRAYMWYTLAANVYLPPGLTSINRGGIVQSKCADMTTEQRSSAIKYLEEWKPGKCEQDLFN